MKRNCIGVPALRELTLCLWIIHQKLKSFKRGSNDIALYIQTWIRHQYSMAFMQSKQSQIPPKNCKCNCWPTSKPGGVEFYTPYHIQYKSYLCISPPCVKRQNAYLHLSFKFQMFISCIKDIPDFSLISWSQKGLYTRVYTVCIFYHFTYLIGRSMAESTMLLM